MHKAVDAAVVKDVGGTHASNGGKNSKGTKNKKNNKSKAWEKKKKQLEKKREQEAIDPISTLTVARLREILRSRGLKVSGKKKELQERLRAKVQSLVEMDTTSDPK